MVGANTPSWRPPNGSSQGAVAFSNITPESSPEIVPLQRRPLPPPLSSKFTSGGPRDEASSGSVPTATTAWTTSGRSSPAQASSPITTSATPIPATGVGAPSLRSPQQPWPQSTPLSVSSTASSSSASGAPPAAAAAAPAATGASATTSVPLAAATSADAAGLQAPRAAVPKPTPPPPQAAQPADATAAPARRRRCCLIRCWRRCCHCAKRCCCCLRGMILFMPICSSHGKGESLRLALLSALCWTGLPVAYLALFHTIVRWCTGEPPDWHSKPLDALIFAGWLFSTRSLLLIGMPVCLVKCMKGWITKRATMYVAMLVEVVQLWRLASQFAPPCNLLYCLWILSFGFLSCMSWLFIFFRCLEPAFAYVEAAAAVLSLSSLSITSRELSSLSMPPTECPICLMAFEPDEIVKVAPCRHAFHEECISRWMQVALSCAVCRQELKVVSKPYCCGCCPRKKQRAVAPPPPPQADLRRRGPMPAPQQVPPRRPQQVQQGQQPQPPLPSAAAPSTLVPIPSPANHRPITSGSVVVDP
eukprot:TRINITY_DN81115_c0_g1_i1.p1 TRINITY_DN81115_c0_g1~~TRINITY_DN81115_c0_g1_i1.p1  ORF type:complete len:550 (+),score=69.52 TRINITY_DN81115_c0_g1_i1:55-1650(+)